MDDLNISKERKIEIDNILKKSLEDYKNGKIKATPLDVFLEKFKKRYEKMGHIKMHLERLQKAEEWLSVLEGRALAIENMEQVIAVVVHAESSKDAMEQLMAQYNLKEEQAHAICHMRVRVYSSEERKKLYKEMDELKEQITELKKSIVTQRLLLEPAICDDSSRELAEAIHKAGEFEWYFGVTETPERLRELSIKRKLFYNIFDSDRNFIGYVGFHKDEQWYEVEIYIIKKYRRRGYAKESLTAILLEAFNGRIEGVTEVEFGKVTASVRKENHASRALMESCGFQQNKEIGLSLLFPTDNEEDEEQELGKFIDLVHYFITKEMFEEIKKGVD